MDARPYVLDPLIHSNQTRRRKARVYDRDVEDGNVPPPPPAHVRRTRAYRRGREVDVRRLAIPSTERRLVRRYLDLIRASEGGGR